MARTPVLPEATAARALSAQSGLPIFERARSLATLCGSPRLRPLWGPFDSNWLTAAHFSKTGLAGNRAVNMMPDLSNAAYRDERQNS